MKKKLIVFGLLFLILFIFAKPLNRPVKNFVIGSSRGLIGFFSDTGRGLGRGLRVFAEIGRLQKENAELAQKLTSFEVDRSKINELEFENNLLKQELGYKEKYKEFTLVPSKIIGREPTDYLDSVLIDKGKSDEVASGMAVISGGVLVGQVKEVYDNQSRVVLVTSKDSIILAMLQKTRSKGVLRGGVSGLVLDDIVRDVEYKPGDEIVTSGLDNQLKEGILIGRAGSIQTGSSELFKRISVEPIADLAKLEMVFIVK